MSTHNIGFYEEINEIMFLLSSNTHLIFFSGQLYTNMSMFHQKLRSGSPGVKIIMLTHKTNLNFLQSPDEEREGEEGEQVAEEETIVYKYVPPEAKEWKSLGSEKEILEESVKDMRRRVGGLGILR